MATKTLDKAADSSGNIRLEDSKRQHNATVTVGRSSGKQTNRQTETEIQTALGQEVGWIGGPCGGRMEYDGAWRLFIRPLCGCGLKVVDCRGL